jgi:HJR/Mrr/RecB family endonuclease
MKQKIRELDEATIQVILNEALLKLPELERLVVVLADAQGLSRNEIAKIMDSSVSQILKRLYAARRKLRLVINSIVQCRESPRASHQIRVGFGNVNRELCAWLHKHPDALFSITPREFEHLIAGIIKDMGAHIELTQQTRDGGRDIIAEFETPVGKLVGIIDCKRYKPDSPVGINIVERLMWIKENKDRASFGAIVTTSYFTQPARKLEADYKAVLKLHDFNSVIDWLNRFGTWEKVTPSGLILPNPNLKL